MSANTGNDWNTGNNGNSGTAGNAGVAGVPRQTPPLRAPWYGIGFGGAVARFFRKTFIASWRASRSEYWWAMLFTVIVSAVAIGVTTAIGTAAGVSYEGGAGGGSPLDTLLDDVSIIVMLVLLIPTITLSIRRLHDTNRRGLWLLLPALLHVGAVLPVFVAGVINGYNGAEGHAEAPAVVVGLLASFALYILGSLSWVILMVLPSDPRGARFDAPSAAVPAGTVGAPGTPGAPGATGAGAVR
ncbi:DUF805 domain-containing protein [Bifidobacterium aesculapii]|uniref:DUF805 domain-containing protein n=1 Tax=Bifidobacterium aesculapii TaxID=1329411 RepID=UPI0006E20537|nr:DUF805 domain-containing protein [Bifidobacterium aesculapii]